jgi:hypothetical protein
MSKKEKRIYLAEWYKTLNQFRKNELQEAFSERFAKTKSSFYYRLKYQDIPYLEILFFAEFFGVDPKAFTTNPLEKKKERETTVSEESKEQLVKRLSLTTS